MSGWYNKQLNSPDWQEKGLDVVSHYNSETYDMELLVKEHHGVV